MTDIEHWIGNTSIIKVPELELRDFTVTQLLPNLNPVLLSTCPDWINERTYDRETEKVLLSVHTWVVKHRGCTILIDTGAGNRKDRPRLKVLHHLHGPFISRLAKAGVQADEVDYVLLTHVHADHVGWNTSYNGGSWHPTFPNATVICSDLECRYGSALAQGDETVLNQLREEAGVGEPIRLPVAGVWQDSLEPVEASGKLKRIAIDGSEILEGIRFLSTPGHSIDHASIVIRSGDEEAIFGGDILHHPFELLFPNLISMFCEFPDAARQSRRTLLERAEESHVTYFSSHFPDSSAGKVIRDGEGHRWQSMG